MIYHADYKVTSTTSTTATLTPTSTGVVPEAPSQIVLTFPVSTHHHLVAGAKVVVRLQA